MDDKNLNNSKSITLDPRRNNIYNVKTITSLPEIGIDDISDKVLNSSYAVFAYDGKNSNRYVSHKVKFSDIMDKAFERSWTYIDVLKDELTYFMNELVIKSNPTYLSIVKKEIKDDFYDWYNKRLGYFFVINPELSELRKDDTDYIVSYIPVRNPNSEENEIIDWTYSYIYSSYLTPGLISYTTLQEYVDCTLERIMGVPNSYEGVDEAINSIQEFVNWFGYYIKTDPNYGSLAYLINTIERNDENIRQLSYDYTDLNKNLAYIYTDKKINQVNNTLNSLDFSYSCADNRYLTGITQVNGHITAVTDRECVSGAEVNIDTAHDTFVVGTTRYKLSKNSDGELGFVTVSALEFDATGGGSFEYGATLSDTQKQISYTISKTATVTINNTVITSPYIVTSLNNKTNQTITVKAVPADNYPPECTDTVSFNFNKYKYWAFVDSSNSLTSGDVLSITAKSAIVNGYPTTRTDFSIGTNESKYIYVMIKKKSSGSFTFKIGQGTEPGQNTGGMTQIEDNITGIYDNNVKYQLWRSTTVKTANCNIIIS